MRKKLGYKFFTSKEIGESDGFSMRASESCVRIKRRI